MAMHRMSPAAKRRNGNGNGHCPHHWMIESARGDTSTGKCVLCGEVREFKNVLPDIRFFGGNIEKSREGGRIGGKRKGGGANSYNYIPILREFEGRIY